jgi:hypothetical protein
MHRWCFSIGNVAKRGWDKDAPSLKQTQPRVCLSDAPLVPLIGRVPC